MFLPAYHRNPKTTHLDCQRIMNNDTVYIQNMAKSRVNYTDPDNLAMDCGAIFSRNYFSKTPDSFLEEAFPLAQARVVFKVVNLHLTFKKQINLSQRCLKKI